MFSCVWLHFKKCFRKYFLMFGCVLENIIENTFFTCCSHFLTFSRLPNEYIISFIPQNTNKTYKKNHQIRTNGEIAIAIDADRRGPGDHAVVFGTLANHADQRGAGDHADRSLSLSLSVFCSRGFFLSVALSLFCACYEKCLKVKQFCKMISGSTSANFGQTKIIFRKIYFS